MTETTMRHRLALMLPLILAACNGSPFPGGRNSGSETATANSVTTTTTTNMINTAAPAAPPVDANAAGNVSAPDANGSAAQPAANTSGNGSDANPNAGDRVGGRELDEEAANLDFIVVNRTGHKIIGLSIKPFDDNRWSSNVLAGRDVPNKERAAATYTRDVEICRWDLKATFDNGTARVFPNTNLCDTVRVELR